jgi:rhodanese-related sulfurtransferase
MDTILTTGLVLVLLFGAVYFTLQKAGEEEEDEKSLDQLILEATRSLLARGEPTLMEAAQLYSLLADGPTENDPFLLSVRNLEDYETGHIPGAVQIPWKSVFTVESLEALPNDRQIVVYCYNGNIGNQVSILLELLGYDAVSLRWGMCAWNIDPAHSPTCFQERYDSGDYPIVTGEEPGSLTWPMTRSDPPLGCGEEGDPASGDEGDGEDGDGDGEEGDIRERIHSHLNSGLPKLMVADNLFSRLNDSDPEDDPFVLDIRGREDYALGHVPGAVNIGFREIFTEGGMSQLPEEDRQMVVVGPDGHLGHQAAALLAMNGYNALALRWGMTSWTTNRTVAPDAYDPEQETNIFPVASGAGPGEWNVTCLSGTR